MFNVGCLCCDEKGNPWTLWIVPIFRAEVPESRRVIDDFDQHVQSDVHATLPIVRRSWRLRRSPSDPSRSRVQIILRMCRVLKLVRLVRAARCRAPIGSASRFHAQFCTAAFHAPAHQVSNLSLPIPPDLDYDADARTRPHSVSDAYQTPPQR